MGYIHVFTVVLFFSQGKAGYSTIIPLPVEKETGCYGNTAADFLEPQCSGSKIAVSKVYAMTKRVDTGCPNVATIIDHDEAKCCTVAPEDCKMEYRTESEDILQAKCTGLEDCKVPIAWMETTCNATQYLKNSNYMQVDYHCVPDDLILQATSSEDGSTGGRAVYLQNTGYPAGSDIAGVCSVTSSCKTTLAISVIHMHVTGDCDHVIQVSDDGEDNYIDCSNNNDDDYALADVYFSSSHFLILNLDGVGVVNSGPLWIQVRGQHENSTVELGCGTSALSVPPAVGPCEEEEETTSVTPSTSTSLPATSSEPPILSSSPLPSPSSSPPHSSSSTSPPLSSSSSFPSSSPSSSSSSSFSSPTTESLGSSSSEGLSVGAIVGIVIGIIGVLAIIANIIIFVIRIYKDKKRNKVSPSKASASDDTNNASNARQRVKSSHCRQLDDRDLSNK